MIKQVNVSNPTKISERSNPGDFIGKKLIMLANQKTHMQDIDGMN
jgi:hypothetical protein